MTETWGAPTAAREQEEDLLEATPSTGSPVGTGAGKRFSVDGDMAPLVEESPPPARVWERIEATLREEGRIRDV